MRLEVRSARRFGGSLAATVALAIAFAGVVVVAPQPAAAGRQDPTLPVGGSVSRSESRRAVLFWTPERMRSATEYVPTMPTVEDRGVTEPTEAEVGRPGIGPASVGPTEDSPIADGARVARPRTVEPEDDAAPTTASSPTSPAQRVALAASATYYSYAWNGATNTTPATAMGRIFFQVPGEPWTNQHFCSGTVVSSEGRNMVFTAGHCVYTPVGTNRQFPSAGGPHYNVVFCPGYRNSGCPYGQWRVENWNATTGWMNSASMFYDLGVLRMQPINGWEIASWVGSIGITWNQPYSASTAWYAFGYPYDSWNGYGPYFPGGAAQNLWVCSSYEKRYGNPVTQYGYADNGPPTIGIDCNMTGGASGGGWLRGGTTGRLDGVNSYKPTVGGQEQMFSPYFGEAVQNLFAAARYG
jgi:hypothetical protein